MDYKSTLNLPQTDFPMKAGLTFREPGLLAKWEKMGLYEKLCAQAQNRSLFILHDGPPYANGHIHIGTALNKILKDIIVRYKTMRGYRAPYIPGWDCHGLPVEHQLFKDLNKTKDQIDRVEFRGLAYQYAMKYVGIQREEFKRLGVVGDWGRPYLTLDKKYEHVILVSFGKLVEKGFVYRGLKPVNWCFKCETALAEAEVEYADHESDSVFVKFEVKENELTKRLNIASQTKVFILIWTTTPWTLMANVAVTLHPDLEYLLVEKNGSGLIMAKDLFELFLREKLGLQNAKILTQFKGKALEGLVYQHPFGLREGRVVLADYVSCEEGTGCVHTAPGHGQEDFATGLKYGLDVVMPVDEKGRYDKSVGEFAGMHVLKANEQLIQRLHQMDRLALVGKLSHSYPHCWRCKTPVIFRATEQWFLKIDHEGLRGDLLKAIQEDVSWVPASGKERISRMVEGRPDWCLSRQRYWGVPIPAIICLGCQKHTLDSRVIHELAQRVLEEGTDVWFKADIKEFLPKDVKCSCGHGEFEKSNDILDVWFDSGVSHQAVLKQDPSLKCPADLYLEGSDQHRGWFQASLIPSVAIDGQSPYKTVLTHGFVVDGQGRKMSKSLGNVIAPQEIMKDDGADILRLWVFSSDYTEDVRISPEILKFVRDAYRKMRNTVRFLLGNLGDYQSGKDAVLKEEMLEIDKWALYKLRRLIEDVTRDFEAYRFYHAFQSLYKFCNEEMSSLYLDILKDRLYTSAKKSTLRRSAQTALYEILHTLIKLFASIMPFSAEEMYQHMVKAPGGAFESVHLESWPRIQGRYQVEEAQVKGIDKVLQLRTPVLGALEEMRGKAEIGSALEAKVILEFRDKDHFEFFRKYLTQLPSVFIVSQVDVTYNPSVPASEGFSLDVRIERAEGVKCARCWNYNVDVGKQQDYPGLCGRCIEAVKE